MQLPGLKQFTVWAIELTQNKAMFNRSRRNLARWFTLSMGGILVVFSGILYYQEAVEQLEVTDRLLYKKTRVMAASVQCEFIQGQARVDLSNVPFLGNSPPPLDSEIVYARWYDEKGKLRQFFGAPSKEHLSENVEFKTIKTTNDLTKATPKVLWLRQVTLPVQYKGEALGYLQVAMPMTAAQDTLKGFLLLLAIAVPVTLGAISLVGWFLSGLAMQPIRSSYDHLQRFTGNASHELRAPLAAILSNAQVGLLTPADNGDSKHLRLEKIAEIAKSMNTLISNLLFLARRSGQLSPESLKEVDLTDLLGELIDFQATTTAAQNLDIKSDLPEQSIVVEADPDLLRQAVANLLGNACKYTKAGGMVNLRLFTQSCRAVIQVEDNGIGIPAADLPYIFERFYRVDGQRGRETGSFGLGLAIALAIVEAHNGHLSVQSEVGQGSIFQIELPLSGSVYEQFSQMK